MRICLDYQPAVAQRAGIGRYTRLLARHLPAYLSGGDSLRLFYLDFKRKADPPDVPSADVRAWRLMPGAVLQQLWKRGLPPAYDALAGKADLYHFTNFIIPTISRRAKTVATVFDMSFMRLPQCAEAKNLAYMTSRIGKTIDRADAVITISDFSAREIAEFFPAAEGKTFSIPLGIDQTLAPPPSAMVAETRRRLGLERPYLLSVGTLEPRKNYAFLVEAFEKMRNQDLDLVIAGMPGWRCEPILEKFRTSPARDRVRYLKYVADGDLAALYTGATAFVCASLYEGFGFPPLEAMLCRAPVVSSTGGSLPEVLGDGARIIDGFDADHWAAELDAVVGDETARRDLVERGTKRAAAFTWEKTAEATASVYRSVSGGRK